MVATITSFLIAIAVLGIVYIIFKWIVGSTGLPAPLVQIGNIIFGIVAVVIVLRYLLPLL